MLSRKFQQMAVGHLPVTGYPRWRRLAPKGSGSSTATDFGKKPVERRENVPDFAGMSEVLSTFRLVAGDEMPEFSLPDAGGKVSSRDELMSGSGMVVVFACNHCPFVVHVADALGECAENFVKQGVSVVAINSNDAENYPADAPQHMGAFALEHGWKFPYLVDESQEVAKAFGAACTPDFFVFDGAGKLFYAGQFDDSRPKSGQAATGGDLAEAVRRMVDSEAPLVRPYPSSGCNIKWKPENQPDWWNSGR